MPVERLQGSAGETQIGDGGKFGSMKWQRVSEKCFARLQRITDAARYTRQVDQSRAPPEVGA